MNEVVRHVQDRLPADAIVTNGAGNYAIWMNRYFKYRQFGIVNNGMFGTIRRHQEIHYPGRVHGTGLDNPDFRALAQACGAHGERVLRSEEFPAAFERALGAGRPAVIELVEYPHPDNFRTAHRRAPIRAPCHSLLPTVRKADVTRSNAQ